jgi:hypothetical protein
LQVGDPKAPDFVAGDAEVSYGLRGLTLEVRSVRLTKPIVRARLHDGKLTLGSLDPLIQDLLKQPPRPDATKPRIEGRRWNPAADDRLRASGAWWPTQRWRTAS